MSYKKILGGSSTPFIPIAIGIIILLLGKKLLGMFDGLGESLGIKDNENDRRVNKIIQTISVTSPWSPAFYKSAPPGTNIKTVSFIDSIAKLVWTSFTTFGLNFSLGNDDEAQCIGAFKRLKSKAQVSFLVERFYYLYKQDLLPYLQGGTWPQDRLSNDELTIITDYVASLPKY
jgi:hypothetical protein